MNKGNVVYIHNQIIHKKEKNMSFAGKLVKLEIIILQK